MYSESESKDKSDIEAIMKGPLAVAANFNLSVPIKVLYSLFMLKIDPHNLALFFLTLSQ